MDTEYNKALVGVIMAILILLEVWFGWHVTNFLSEEVILSILALLTPILVWLIPNRPT